MISTPDTVLQSVVKRALIDSGCPLELASQLIGNSHERRYSGGFYFFIAQPKRLSTMMDKIR